MRIKYEDLLTKFEGILISRGFTKENAKKAATIFADNSLDGVYTHGVNRFPKIIELLDKKLIDPSKTATKEFAFGSFERWNGNRGFGPLNAYIAMSRACELAKENGIGIVALGNNNHWLRGGTYGWQACKNGMIGICWSNTIANMPAWGGKDPKIGNNPLVIGVPRSNEEHFVLDFAISQYSYGKVEETRLKGEKLPYPGGYDSNGNLSVDPIEIEKTRRFLPVGYWKGSGLSIALDLIATVLSKGNSVAKITSFEEETGLSQIMIAINPEIESSKVENDKVINLILDDIKNSVLIDENKKIRYPGEKEFKTRKENLVNGIPVLDEIWERIESLVK